MIAVQTLRQQEEGKATLYASIIACVVAVAAGQDSGGWQGSVEQRFKQRDRDGDEKLSRAEYPQPEIFDAVDANEDGFAMLEEVQAYFQNRRGPDRATTTPPAQASLYYISPSGKFFFDPGPKAFHALDKS